MVLCSSSYIVGGMGTGIPLTVPSDPGRSGTTTTRHVLIQRLLRYSVVVVTCGWCGGQVYHTQRPVLKEEVAQPQLDMS